MAREFMSPASDESIAVRTITILRRRALIAAVAFTTVIAAAIAFAVYLPDLYKASAIAQGCNIVRGELGLPLTRVPAADPALQVDVIPGRTLHV